MLGGILLIALVAAALLYMLGMADVAKRIGVAVLGLAILAPVLAQLLLATVQRIDGRLIGVIFLGASLAVFVAGWIRFVNHRRHLHHWWGETPTSSKNRVEEDL